MVNMMVGGIQPAVLSPPRTSQLESRRTASNNLNNLFIPTAE